MRGKFGKILVIVISALGTLASVYFTLQMSRELKKLPDMPVKETAHAPAADSHGGSHGEAKADSHGAPADAHGSPPADAHGGGHGEAAKADAHGAPPADGHGGGHGAAAAPARTVAGTVSLVSLDEVFANISTEDINHTLAVKLELELFDEKSRSTIEAERMQAGIKNTIIQASREQPFDRLNSQAGKLYYKEYLVQKLNEYLREPIVRDIHFASFFLQ